MLFKQVRKGAITNSIPDGGSFKRGYPVMTREWFEHSYVVPKLKEASLPGGSSKDFYSSMGRSGRANGQMVQTVVNTGGMSRVTNVLVVGSVAP